MFIWQSRFDRAIRGIHYHIREAQMATQADLDALKASADATVEDLAKLRATVKDLADKLANTPADDTAAIQAVTKELQDAVAIDAPPAPPPA